MTCVDNFETLHACTSTQVTLVEIVQYTVIYSTAPSPLAPQCKSRHQAGNDGHDGRGLNKFSGESTGLLLTHAIQIGSKSIPVCLLESTVRRRRQVKAN